MSSKNPRKKKAAPKPSKSSRRKPAQKPSRKRTASKPVAKPTTKPKIPPATKPVRKPPAKAKSIKTLSRVKKSKARGEVKSSISKKAKASAAKRRSKSRKGLLRIPTKVSRKPTKAKPPAKKRPAPKRKPAPPSAKRKAAARKGAQTRKLKKLGIKRGKERVTEEGKYGYRDYETRSINRERFKEMIRDATANGRLKRMMYATLKGKDDSGNRIYRSLGFMRANFNNGDMLEDLLEQLAEKYGMDQLDSVEIHFATPRKRKAR